MADEKPRIFKTLDEDKLAEVALGLLSLTLHNESRAWKGLDWDVMDLLFQRGWIHDPRGKAKSVALTVEGLEIADQMLRKHFGTSSDPGRPPR